MMPEEVIKRQIGAGNSPGNELKHILTLENLFSDQYLGEKRNPSGSTARFGEHGAFRSDLP